MVKKRQRDGYISNHEVILVSVSYKAVGAIHLIYNNLG